MSAGGTEPAGGGHVGPDIRRGASGRERLLGAATQEVVARGYAATSVTSLVERAGITRTAFYKAFPDIEQCVLAACEEAAGRLEAEVAAALDGAEPQHAERAALAAAAGFAQREPADFLLATREASGATPALTAGRSALVGRLADLLEGRWGEAAGDRLVPDLPALLVIGGVIRYLGMAMLRGPLDWAREQSDLEGWLDAYRVPASERRWAGLRAQSQAGPTPSAAPTVNRIRPPRALPRGRSSLRLAAVASIERERIVHATAAQVSREGYAASSVAAIAAAAGISREAFYRHFDGKGEALDAAVTLLFEQSMAAMAGAYFAVGMPWPDRIWDSSRALTEVLSSAPDFTHVAFIDAFAPDHDSARRAEGFFLGFTIFLAQGAEAAHGRPISRAAPRAITAATIELGAACAAAGAVAELPRLVPLGVLLTIAPYTGVDQARAFVESCRPQGSRSSER